MKIENKIPDQTDFEDIYEGDVFECDDGQVYMKISCIKVNGVCYNAVNLRNGNPADFDSEELVYPLYNAAVIL